MSLNMNLVPVHIKKLVYCLITLCTVMIAPQGGFAQDKPRGNNDTDAQQKIEALKTAYLTQQLDLTPQEAEKFWPLYDRYQKDMHSIIEERKQIQMDKNQLNRADNRQIEQSMNRDFQLQQQALQLRKKYRQEFQDVLPPRKVMKVYRSEKDFNLKLIEALHRRQSDPAGNDKPAVRPQRSQPAIQAPPRRQAPQATPPSRKFSPPSRSPGQRGSQRPSSR